MGRTRCILIGQAAVFGWCMGLILLLSPASHAQQISSDAIREKLSTPVKLAPGRTTLSALALQLSEKCGVPVEPAEYLQERVMVVQLNTMSARSALDAICELNDWMWKETPEKHVLISRKASKLPASPAYIFRRIHVILPRDVRDYLGVEPRSEDPGQYINPLAEFDPEKAARRNEQRTKLWRLFKNTQSQLNDSLPQSVLDGEPLAYKKMSQIQRDNLMVQICFPIFDLFLRQGKTFTQGDFATYVYDPRTAVVTLKGNELDVNVTFDLPNGQTTTGFGVELHP